MMGTKLNRHAYVALIDEDVARVEKEMHNSLERDHIIQVLRHSVECYYPGTDSSKGPPIYVQGDASDTARLDWPASAAPDAQAPVSAKLPPLDVLKAAAVLTFAHDPDAKLLASYIASLCPQIPNGHDPLGNAMKARDDGTGE
jgi:hypothetical protein